MSPLQQNQFLDQFIKPGVMQAFAKAGKAFGTDDLVGFVPRPDEAANGAELSFHPRLLILDLVDPTLERIQATLTLPARERLRQRGTPPIHGAFWLVAAIPTQQEPMVAVIAAFPVAQGGEA